MTNTRMHQQAMTMVETRTTIVSAHAYISLNDGIINVNSDSNESSFKSSKLTNVSTSINVDGDIKSKINRHAQAPELDFK